MKSQGKRALLDRCLSIILPALLVSICLAPTSAFAMQGPCTLGPGSVVTTTFSIENTVAGDAAASAIVPPGLVPIPGSCVTNGPGTCQINGQSVVYTGAHLANSNVSISFKSQVGDAVAAGTQLCVIIVRSVTNNPPIDTVQQCQTVDCPATGPGGLPAGVPVPNDQLPASVLIYNLYTSNATTPNVQNTQISVSNIEPTRGIALHLFFVEGTSCSVSDRFTCLTPNQTATFYATDMDPGTTGYLVMVAVDTTSGCPVNFNFLIGEAFVKFSNGHAANLAAEGVPAIAGGLSTCNTLSLTANLDFNGVGYARLGAVLAASTIPSAVEGNNTLLVVNRLGGSLQTGPGTIGNLFGMLFDDGEAPHSFGIVSGACQFRGILSNSLPRTSPQFDVVIPAGHIGWMKFWREPEGALSGVLINQNSFSGISGSAFDQGHNLHKIRLSPSVTMTMPIFPPSC